MANDAVRCLYFYINSGGTEGKKKPGRMMGQKTQNGFSLAIPKAKLWLNCTKEIQQPPASAWAAPSAEPFPMPGAGLVPTDLPNRS